MTITFWCPVPGCDTVVEGIPDVRMMGAAENLAEVVVRLHAEDHARRLLEASRTPQHDCLAQVPEPIAGGAFIPGLTTWRCPCGRRWGYEDTGWIEAPGQP